jgi:NitT/TauT family transport system substrate-binding protein
MKTGFGPRHLLPVLMALTIAAPWSCGGEDRQTSPRTYKVGMLHWAAYTPLHVAEAKGFWKDQGLSIEIVNRVSNQELNGDLRNKRVDIALDMMGSWVGMYMEGTPLTIIGETDWSYGGDKIIAQKGLDLGALKGSKVAIYLDQPSVTFFLGTWLKEKGLRLSDVTVVELETTSIAEQFLGGKFPLTVNYDPQALKQYAGGGTGELVKTSRDYPGVIPEGFVAHRDVFATLDKRDLVKFIIGWQRAVKWSKDPANLQEYVKIMREKTFAGDGPFTDEEMQSFIDGVKVHDAKAQLERNSTNTGLYKYLTDLRQLLEENGKLKKDYRPEDLFDNTAIVEALRQVQ